MSESRLRALWKRLQGKKPHLPHFLAEIHLKGIRGIHDVRVVFDYPVSLLRKACSAEFLPEAAVRARVSGRDAAFAGWQ